MKFALSIDSLIVRPVQNSTYSYPNMLYAHSIAYSYYPALQTFYEPVVKFLTETYC